MTFQEELRRKILSAASYATIFATTEGSSILTSPISKESDALLYQVLLNNMPLLIDPESGESMEQIRIDLRADDRDRPMGLNIALVNGGLALTSFGGIRQVDGIPERWPPDPKK